MEMRHPMETGLRLRPILRAIAAALGLWFCWIAWRTVSATGAATSGGGARSLAVLLAVVGVLALALAFTGAGHAHAPAGDAGDDDRTAAPPPA